MPDMDFIAWQTSRFTSVSIRIILNRGGFRKIHFAAVLCILSGFYCCVVSNSFCQVVSGQLCPDLLFYKLWFIRMETAQANSVLELAERCFNPPSGKIKVFDVLRSESIRRKIGHYAFVRAVI